MANGLLNPRLGEHNMIDDQSGRKIRSDKAVKSWDNLWTNEEDYDPKHPQLTLKSRAEKINAQPSRVRPADVEVTYVDPNSLNGRP